MDSLLFKKVSLDDYPPLKEVDTIPEVLGVALLELHALRGVRLSVLAGYGITWIYYYLGVRWRLPFAQRTLHPLHHYLLPSAGYSACVGLGLGLGYGYYTERLRYMPTEEQQKALVSLLEAQERQAKKEHARYVQHVVRRSEARVRMEKLNFLDRHVWSWLSPASYQRKLDKALELDLTLMSSSSTNNNNNGKNRNKATTAGVLKDKDGYRKYKDWTYFVEPFSLLWVTQHRAPEEQLQRHPPPPPYSRVQVDYLVANVLQKRKDADEDRWARTASRSAVYGGFAGLLLWNQGSLLFRLLMGAGNGVAVGACVSALRLEETFQYI